jgi:restriction system protein
MPIPDYQSIMLPLLKYAGDEEEHSLRETIEALGSAFSLTEDERRELLPSGQQSIFDNRVGWARTYLKKAVLLDSTRRGYFRITARGLEVLASNPPGINRNYLMDFEEFVEFQNYRREGDTDQNDPSPVSDEQTPEELIEIAFQKIRDDLANDLLDKIKSCSPTFFERLVIDLLVKMGYGGTRRDAGQAVGRSGDGGIDGIINEDRLGLDIIYIQAKRWEGTVGRPEIQKFAGALQGQRARKGIFITTSSFSREAQDYTSSIDSKIILIDGASLTQLMVDFNIGVSLANSYEIKRIDLDYFTEE